MHPPLPLGWLPPAPGLFAPVASAASAPTWMLVTAVVGGGLASPLLWRAANALVKTHPHPMSSPLRHWQKPCFVAFAPLLAALTLGRFGATASALAALLLLWTLLVLAWIDAETHLLPDVLTLPLLLAGLAVNAAGWRVPWPQALVGAAAGWLLLWLPQLLFRAVTRRSGVGQGDYKLLAALGAWLGAPALVGVVFYAAVAAVSPILRRQSRTRECCGPAARAGDRSDSWWKTRQSASPVPPRAGRRHPCW